MDYFSTHARSSDPDTSYEAIPVNVTLQGFIVLQSYRSGQALLDHDAYQRAGFGPNARDGQRCSDLRQAGYIERTGERAKTPSGKSGYLCRITPRGLAYLESGDRHDTPPPAPGVPVRSKAMLRNYQQRLVTTLYESDGHMAVLPMGAGKTAIALTAAEEMLHEGEIRHGLVIAPKRVAQLVWPAEIGLWKHMQYLHWQVLNGDARSRGQAMKHVADWHLTILGVDNTQWLCKELEYLPDDHPIFDLLIIDEISRFRNPKSKRARAILGHVGRFRTIWGLTGTPRPNGYEDLFKPLQIVSRETLWPRSFYKWRDERFYPTDYQRYDWAIKPEWEARTVQEAAQWSTTLAPEDMPELPEITVVEHRVDLPAEARRAYRTMESRLFADIDDKTVVAASSGVATVKLAQAANGFMYDETGAASELHTAKREWLEGLVESMAGSPLIIVYEFHEDLRVLRALFGEDLPYLGAGVGDRAAERTIADWNARKLPLLALHPASGGHGLNLQHGGSQMAWFSLTWSPEFYEQTIKRIHRPGQPERCFIHICLTRDTIDEAKRLRVLEKLSAQEAFRRYLKRV
ncbi:MAG TPA: DEAD/DEAH box helicase [Vicinamibacterales bacterium]|nr:DEAD/DEAH box helicase [Vicinamibacterales bacterium]